MRKIDAWLIAGLMLAAVGLSCEASGGKTRYVHEQTGFSFEYPVGYVAEPLQGPTEVARFAMDNSVKLPVLVANVRDNDGERTLDGIPSMYADRLQAAIPGSSAFDLIERKAIVLKDGNDAVFFRVRWTWLDGTTMETVAVAAIKADTTIMISATIMSDRKLSKEVSAICRTLNTTL